MLRRCVIFFLGLTVVPLAEARDFGKERLASVVAQTWGRNYGLVTPIFAAPDPTDVAAFGPGYLGSVWQFTPSPGRGGVGKIFNHDGKYCNPSDIRPAAVIKTSRLKNYVYRFEVGVTGEFTVKGAKSNDVIFKLSALDAKWIDYVSISITDAKLHLVPYNVFKARMASAAESCGDLPYALKSMITGDVTARFFFRRGISAELALNIGSQISANLGFKGEVKEGESESNPYVEVTEGEQVFAVAVDRVR